MKLRCLRPLYDHVGGYVSVYLRTARDHENAPSEVELRWRAARERLAAAGAGAATLDAVGHIVTDPERAAPGRAVFACDGVVTFTAGLETTPPREIARLSPLPHLMPVLAQRVPGVPHLRVLASRGGGEIVAVNGRGDSWAKEAGRDRPVHQVPGGGWPQARFQRSSEETWEENAKELAAGVTDAARRARAERIVVAGDARARSLLLNHLSTPLRAEMLRVAKEAGADSAAVAQAAHELLCAHVDRTTRERFNHWQVRRQHAGAVEGLADTMAALCDGQVVELFLADRPQSTAAAWITPDSADLAMSEEALRQRGFETVTRERADAALVRALAATDADLHFLPGDLVQTGDPTALGGISFPRDGVCATLRWSDTA